MMGEMSGVVDLLPYQGSAAYSTGGRAASADDILDSQVYEIMGPEGYSSATHFPVNNDYPALTISLPHSQSMVRDPYGGYILPPLESSYKPAQKVDVWERHQNFKNPIAAAIESQITTESGYGSSRAGGLTTLSASQSPRPSEAMSGGSSGGGTAHYQYSPVTRTLTIRSPSKKEAKKLDRRVASPARSGSSQRTSSPRAVVMPQFSLGSLMPKSLQALNQQQPGTRYGRTRTDLGMRQIARSEQDLGGFRRRLSSAHSASALQAIEFLKKRIKETKYVTAVFESTKGGLRPVIKDVTKG